MKWKPDHSYCKVKAVWLQADVGYTFFITATEPRIGCCSGQYLYKWKIHAFMLREMNHKAWQEKI